MFPGTDHPGVNGKRNLKLISRIGSCTECSWSDLHVRLSGTQAVATLRGCMRYGKLAPLPNVLRAVYKSGTMLIYSCFFPLQNTQLCAHMLFFHSWSVLALVWPRSLLHPQVQMVKHSITLWYVHLTDFVRIYITLHMIYRSGVVWLG